MLSHLQNHGNRPHTPLDCPVEKRTINSYVEDYNANLADCRNNKNLHENGKYHHSVVGPMMFPLKDIDQVVPATLHIMLGVVLVMYNLLLKECKRKEEINDKWEALSLELLNVELNLRQHAVNISTMINRMNRFEAVVRGDQAENIRLAMSRKSKKKTVGEKCESDCCFVTDYDYNVELVSCSNCNSSYHTMCEGLSPVEEVNAGENPYTCIRCTGIVNVSDAFANQINLLIEEESEMNKEIVGVRTQCDDLKAEYNRNIGARERSLNQALESIKVVCQAYHGSVMVGNHCYCFRKISGTHISN